jgi:L-iditol 2-dehydrogenase
MRAAVLHGKEDVRVEEIPSRPLARGEVRVAIKAALTCGTDLKVFKRGYHAKMIVPPAVFGHELAGIISEVHGETEDWCVGERVVVANSAPCGDCFHCRRGQENLCDDLLFLNGAYAEEVVVPARIVRRNMLRIQPRVSFADAALTEPFACVVQGVADLSLQGGERVLVIGSGPIGLMFTALLKHHGCDVSLAGRGEKRLATGQKLGGTVIEVPVGEDLIGNVRSFGKSFDVVIEAVGQPTVWEAAVQLVRKGGTVNLFGGCPAGSTASFDTGLIHYSSLRILASFHHTPKTVRKALEFIERRVITGEDFVDGSCSLAELPELFRSMSSGNRAVKTFVQT